jgi:hypothetical protein
MEEVEAKERRWPWGTERRRRGGAVGALTLPASSITWASISADARAYPIHVPELRYLYGVGDGGYLIVRTTTQQ